MSSADSNDESHASQDLHPEINAARTPHSNPSPVLGKRAHDARTARERVHALVEPGSFIEAGMLAEPVTSGLSGPSDGVIVGFGTLRGSERCIGVISYDFTVLAGSQGRRSHKKVVRMLEQAQANEWPVVIFAEGAGARAQELDMVFDLSSTFVELSRLSGIVPLVCAVPGPCFAGHAALAGLSDCVIATASATMGMAGPPLVESALQVKLTASEIGNMSLHAKAGSVDVVVQSEADLTTAILRYLGLVLKVQTPALPAEAAEDIGKIVPESPSRAYDVRRVVSCLSDHDTFLELRGDFAPNVVTGFTRLGGFPVGLVANQPLVLAGAVDSNGSDKISRFVNLCDSFGVPLLFLVDTPGFMVGPNAEMSALVRHSARIIHALTHSRSPVITVVLRKAYGLAYYALGAAPFKPVLSLAWPTASYGGMGLEGAAAILSPLEDELVESNEQARKSLAGEMRDRYAGINAARSFGVDDIVYAEETRDLLIRTLVAVAPSASASRNPIDPW